MGIESQPQQPDDIWGPEGMPTPGKLGKKKEAEKMKPLPKVDQSEDIWGPEPEKPKKEEKKAEPLPKVDQSEDIWGPEPEKK